MDIKDAEPTSLELNDFVDKEFIAGDGTIDYKSWPSGTTGGLAGKDMTSYGFIAGNMSESTGVGYSPDGGALYTCPRCPGLHRKYEDCPKPQYDTGDPWDSSSDGNPPVK